MKMLRFGLYHCLCLAALLSRDLANCTIIEDEEPRRTFPARRAIDGTRGRKYYDPEEDSPYDSYGSSNGRYDPYEEETDLSDIRNNVPGEPGVDYPAYTRLPQTEFVCEDQFRGYYADEGAGCQVFHVCDGSFLVSSFLCPIGSIFSQKLLTCDWWNKVDCSLSRNYYVVNSKSLVSEVDDDEILRKAFEMAHVQPAGERIPVETTSQQQEGHRDRKQQQRVFNYDSAVPGNHLPTGQDSRADYPVYPTRLQSRHKSNSNKQPRQRYRDYDYYSGDAIENDYTRGNVDITNPSIKVHSDGEDRQKEHRQGSFRNEYEPSYAPTVPTVATTARRYYSPTVPTTYRPVTAPTTTTDTFGRYDLQFEGSDHLYTARGRSDDTMTAVTSSSRPIEDELKLTNPVATVETPVDKDYDKIQASASFSPKILLPIGPTDVSLTEVGKERRLTTNDTAAALDHKEKAIQENLNRLSQKITETLSILTIDQPNADPAVFSYSRNDEQKALDEHNVTDVSTSSILGNSTVSGPSTIPKHHLEPANSLEPPVENQSPFRVTILDESSTGSTDNVSIAIKTSRQNLTSDARAIRQPVIGAAPIPSSPGDRQSQRESRIFRIIVNNGNATNSSQQFERPKILIEKVKSIDLSASTYTDSTNSTETKMNPKKAQVSFERSVNASSLNWNSGSSDIVSMPTTVKPYHVIEGEPTAKSADSINGLGKEPMPIDTKVTVSSIPDVPPIVSATNEDPQSPIPVQLLFSSKIDDAVELASSPVEFTLTVNKSQEIDPSGDEIRKLIAQREIVDSIGAADYKNFEIVRSNEPPSVNSESPLVNYKVESVKTTARKNHENPKKYEDVENLASNGLQSANYLRSIVALVNTPNSPRPFALEQPRKIDIKTPSDREFVSTNPSLTRSTETIVSIGKESDFEKRLDTLDASASGLTRSSKVNRAIADQSNANFNVTEQKTNQEKLIFGLPEIRRFLNFNTELPVGNFDQSNSHRIQEQRDYERTNGTHEKLNKDNVGTVVQTEFIPSLGFSLNTAEERETYMEAVVKGLLHGVKATEITNDANKTTSAES